MLKIQMVFKSTEDQRKRMTKTKLEKMARKRKKNSRQNGVYNSYERNIIKWASIIMKFSKTSNLSV